MGPFKPNSVVVRRDGDALIVRLKPDVQRLITALLFGVAAIGVTAVGAWTSNVVWLGLGGVLAVVFVVLLRRGLTWSEMKVTADGLDVSSGPFPPKRDERALRKDISRLYRSAEYGTVNVGVSPGAADAQLNRLQGRNQPMYVAQRNQVENLCILLEDSHRGTWAVLEHLSPNEVVFIEHALHDALELDDRGYPKKDA